MSRKSMGRWLLIMAAACHADRQGLGDVLLAKVPPVAFPLTADFNGMVQYRGLDVMPREAQPGHPLKLVHFWKVTYPPGRGWKILARVQGAGQPEIVADHEAAQGRYPVSRWERGDIVRDEQEVVLPSSWKASELKVVVGLVNGPGRLPITMGPKQTENQLLAATVPVRP